MRSVKILLSAGAIALALLILILALQGTATARTLASVTAGFIGPDFPIREGHWSSACNEIHADVAYNGSEDEYLVVFDWDLNGTGDHDIMAITVSAGGQAAMSPFSVAYGSTHDDRRPAIARNPHSDNYLVVWERGPNGSKDIYGKIISHTIGSGTEFLIAGYSGDQVHPDVAYATGSHHYLVVWQDHDPGLPLQPDIRGRCVDYDGAPMGLLFFLGTASGDQTLPSLATNAFDYHWLVAWKDTRDGKADIYGREVSSLSNCSLPASDFVINDQAGWAEAPAVGWGQVGPSVYGEFLVVWPEGSNTFAQRVDGEDYSLIEGPITVSDYDSCKYNPDVVFATEPQDWWVVWQDDRDYG